jgi:hypothetical protein
MISPDEEENNNNNAPTANNTNNDEFPLLDDTSEPYSRCSANDESEAGPMDEISLAATENELLEKVREWFYVLLWGVGLVATLSIGIALYCSQRNNLKRAFHLLTPETISLDPQIAALAQVAAERTRGQWPNAMTVLLDNPFECLDQISILPVVLKDERLSYEAYSVEHAEDWIGKKKSDILDTKRSPLSSVARIDRRQQRLEETAPATIHSKIFDISGQVSPDRNVYLPLWQTVVTDVALSSLSNYVNVDLQSTAVFDKTMDRIVAAVASPNKSDAALVGPPLFGTTVLDALVNETATQLSKEPWVPILVPIHSDQTDEKSNKTLALVLGVFSWRRVLSVGGFLSLEVEMTCGGTNATTRYAFYNGVKDKLVFVGTSSHASRHSRHSHLYKTYTVEGEKLENPGCNYTLHVTPSPELWREFVTYSPILYSVIFLSFAGLVCFMFHGYDVLVEERQKIVLHHSVQADAILSSLFPRQVRSRLLRRNSNASLEYQNARLSAINGGIVEAANSHRIKHFLTTTTTTTTDTEGEEADSSPIADLFPNCTGA